MSYLMHYGVKGQKWGVRRFENKDGTLTEEGKKRYAALRTRKDVEGIFKSFSKEDKKLLNAGENDTEYMSKDAHGYWVVKRFIAHEGKTAVAFMDILKGKDGEAEIAIGTDAKYRGKGYAAEVAQRGAKWLDEHPDAFKKVNWGAYSKNEASTKLAEKSGFKFDKEESGFSTYTRKG